MNTKIALSPTRTFPLWIFPILAGLASYFLSLFNGFVLDDFLHFFGNKSVIDGMELKAQIIGRQLPYLLWRGLYLCFGLNPLAFHAINLCVHLAGAVALFFVVIRLAPYFSVPQQKLRSFAMWAGIIFAIHPYGSETVNYSGQLSSTLFNLFSLLAVLFLLKWRETPSTRSIAGTALFILLAAQSKEPAMIHVGICVFFVWLITRKEKSPATKIQRGPAIAFIGVMIASSPYWFTKISQQLAGERLISHILTQARIFGGYLWRMVAPFHLSADHHVPWSTSFNDWPATIALCLIIAGAAAILYFSIIRRSKFAALAGLITFHLLLRFAYVNEEVIVEYRVYPCLPWVAFALALAFYHFGQRLPQLQTLKPAIAGIAIFGITLANLHRTTAWNNDLTVMEDILEDYPLNIRAHTMKLVFLDTTDDPQAVVDHLGESEDIRDQLNAYNAAHPHRQYGENKIRQFYNNACLTMAPNLAKVGRLKHAFEMANHQVKIHHPNGMPEDPKDIFWESFYVRAQILAMAGQPKDAANDWAIASKNLPNRFSIQRIEAMEKNLATLSKPSTAITQASGTVTSHDSGESQD
jgi:hypothetical protein